MFQNLRNTVAFSETSYEIFQILESNNLYRAYTLVYQLSCPSLNLKVRMGRKSFFVRWGRDGGRAGGIEMGGGGGVSEGKV